MKVQPSLFHLKRMIMVGNKWKENTCVRCRWGSSWALPQRRVLCNPRCGSTPAFTMRYHGYQVTGLDARASDTVDLWWVNRSPPETQQEPKRLHGTTNTKRERKPENAVKTNTPNKVILWMSPWSSSVYTDRPRPHGCQRRGMCTLWWEYPYVVFFKWTKVSYFLCCLSTPPFPSVT